MVDLLVVVVDVVLNSCIKVKTIIDGLEVGMVVRKRFPKTLNPDIIQGPSFAIH